MRLSTSFAPSFVATLALACVAFLSAGCETHDCVSTCQRLFVDGQVGGTTACGIAHPGQSTEDLLDACSYECEGALENPGEMGKYNPDERVTGSTSVSLETDVQAAAWMDCVWATDCRYLEEGYCAPTSFSM